MEASLKNIPATSLAFPSSRFNCNHNRVTSFMTRYFVLMEWLFGKEAAPSESLSFLFHLSERLLATSSITSVFCAWQYDTAINKMIMKRFFIWRYLGY